jgi:hypothetical protein
MKTVELDEVALEELITLYCDSWGEPDPARRYHMLQQVWAENGTYTDPTVHMTGSKELVEYIGKILKKYPGARIVRTSVVDAHHGMVRFTWRLARADGQTLTEGVDFGELSSEGKLRRIVGFFGQLAARQPIG